jgi:hypothetical protein
LAFALQSAKILEPGKFFHSRRERIAPCRFCP